MAQDILSVEGMTCEHCVATVTNTVESTAGVRKVLVSLDDKNVVVDYDETATNLEKISDNIALVGFKVI